MLCWTTHRVYYHHHHTTLARVVIALSVLLFATGTTWCSAVLPATVVSSSLRTTTATGQRRVCNTVSLRNNLNGFERALRNCTIVSGSVQLVLIENVQESDWEGIQFPELEEITDYLLVYRVAGLRSLGSLFPNLAVIRGDRMFEAYALVMFSLPHMTEIGLTKLAYIAQGSVNIARCYNLCYAKTVNWSKIQPRNYHFHYEINTKKEMMNTTCSDCAPECNGYCWNARTCFTRNNDNCHPECVGCRDGGTTASHCLQCRNYRNNGVCMAKCPSDKVTNDDTRECMTEAECTTFLNSNYFTFNGACINSCPSKYQPSTDDSTEPCVYCGDNCYKLCQGKTLDNLSSVKDMYKCTTINGSLILKISDMNTADALIKNMDMIQVITGALTIIRSNMITSFDFLPKLREIGNEKNESLIVRDNDNLERLFNMTDPRRKLVLNGGLAKFHFNPRLCLSEIYRFTKRLNIMVDSYDISPYSNGEKANCGQEKLNVTTAEASPYSVKLVWSQKDNITMYLFSYIEDTNITWSRTYCEEDDWATKTTYTNSVTIDNLKPYVKYNYYIRWFKNESSQQTEVQSFWTLSLDPSPPRHVKAISYKYDTIKLSWSPPEVLNGELAYYLLTRYQEPDVEANLYLRNYCNLTMEISSYEVSATASPMLFKNNATQNSNDTCKCAINPRKADYIAEFSFLDHIEDWCGYLEGEDDISSVSVGCKNYRYVTGDSGKYKRTDVGYTKAIETSIPANVTSYEIQNLDPYRMYVFLLSACNVNRTETPQCSEIIYLYNRTRRKDDGDDIKRFQVRVEGPDALLSWSDPPMPNSVILRYDINYRGDSRDAECLPRPEALKMNYNYRAAHLNPGEYQVRIRAVSLAGPGNYTSYITFEIASTESENVTAYIALIVILPFFLAIIAVVAWFLYKRRKPFDRLITTVNPDYNIGGGHYIPDKWEMDRDDIEILDILGEGTFGLVNTGLIKSQQKYVAVKTVNDNASWHDREDFLREATVMKSFDTHHVIRLIGVVSRTVTGQVPLVVMELMTRGDLKTFLRRSRDSSSTITCVELYRMAIEIADGMAYLSAKKYIHRDLAARNCMVSADHTVKIGDFGMARDIYFNDYYRKETKGLLPVRWMAPESLADGVFTSDSDVWSYGVVLWEMTTLAEQPYQGLTNEQVFQFVTAHGILRRPMECPDLLYEIMSGCWKWRPTFRPLFTDIVRSLETCVGQNFKLLSFYHSREGEEVRMNNKERPNNAPALSKNHIGAHWSTVDQDQVSLYSDQTSLPKNETYLSLSHQRGSSSPPEYDGFGGDVIGGSSRGNGGLEHGYPDLYPVRSLQ